MYLRSLRDFRNYCAHGSLTITSEQELDEHIKAFATLYVYVTGMCYKEIKEKYNV